MEKALLPNLKRKDSGMPFNHFSDISLLPKKTKDLEKPGECNAAEAELVEDPMDEEPQKLQMDVEEKTKRGGGRSSIADYSLWSGMAALKNPLYVCLLVLFNDLVKGQQTQKKLCIDNSCE